LTQALITSLPQNSRSYTFVDDGELASPPQKKAPVAAVVQEEEEEEEEEEEDEVFQAPAPTVKQPVAKAAPVVTLDDDAEDAEPVPVPKKIVAKKKIIAKAK
jgi:CO dehydrogenase/acetyl-CoA synthase beta subunit